MALTILSSLIMIRKMSSESCVCRCTSDVRCMDFSYQSYRIKSPKRFAFSNIFSDPFKNFLNLESKKKDLVFRGRCLWFFFPRWNRSQANKMRSGFEKRSKKIKSDSVTKWNLSWATLSTLSFNLILCDKTGCDGVFIMRTKLNNWIGTNSSISSK